MKKILIAAMFLVLYGAQGHTAAVSSAGGKKSVARMLDSSGGPIMFNDDKPWKVFESTGPGAAFANQIVDESGVAPKQGIINKICLSSAPTTTWASVYDSSTTATLTGNLGISIVNKRLAPALNGSTTSQQCLTVNSLFTSGAFLEVSTNLSGPGGAYVLWRELGGYR